MNTTPSEQIYQLYVELVDSYPPIWRSLQLSSQTTLADLHPILQAVMGWTNQYPHFFSVNGQRYGNDDTASNSGSKDAVGLDEIALTEVFASEEQPCFYTYDPKEGWLHRIELDQVLEAQPDQTYPYCIDGERACPPEKSGGVWGYEEFLERLNDPDDPEYDALWEQAGASFDPEKFNVKAVNQRLEKI